MKYWFIIHSLPAYHAHNDYIGKEKQRARKIENVNKGDRIVYYATGDSVILGTFDVITNKKEWANDEHWEGPHICMKIKPRKLAKGPRYIRIQDLLKEVEPPLSIFRDRKFIGIKFKDRTSVEITEKDFKSIEKYIKSYKPAESKSFRGRGNDENLGKPLDLEIMNYAPTSEQGVVALFAHFMGRMKNHRFEKIEFIRQGFPDACAIEEDKSGYSRKYIAVKGLKCQVYTIHGCRP